MEKVNSGPKYNKLEAHQLNWLTLIGHSLSLYLLRIIIHFKFRSFTVTGKENIPPRGLNYIMGANHTCAWDPPFISCALDYRMIAYMAKKELFQHPFAAWYFYSMGTFSVNRDKLEMSTVRTALMVLKHPGWMLGIFPEGTRNESGEIRETKKGLAYMAQLAKVGVLPIGIIRSGEDNMDITVNIGEFIPYDKDKSVEDLSEEVKIKMANLLKISPKQQTQAEALLSAH